MKSQLEMKTSLSGIKQFRLRVVLTTGDYNVAIGQEVV